MKQTKNPHLEPATPERPKPRQRTRRAVGTKIGLTGGGKHPRYNDVFESYAVVSERLRAAHARGEFAVELHFPDESTKYAYDGYQPGTFRWSSRVDWNKPGIAVSYPLSQIVYYEPRIVEDKSDEKDC